MQAAQDLLQAVKRGFDHSLFRQPVRSPVWMYAGMMLAADASTSWGLGLHVGAWHFMLPWETATLEAIERSRRKLRGGNRVSISPLEMIAQAGLAVLAVARWGQQLRGQVVLRCDNQSCCDVIASRRPRSAAMRMALTFVEMVEKQCRLSVWLVHVPTDENVGADALSKGKGPAASEWLAGQGWGDPKQVTEEFMLNVALDGTRASLGHFLREAERKVRGALDASDIEIEGLE
jgi:hypothetical protein